MINPILNIPIEFLLTYVHDFASNIYILPANWTLWILIDPLANALFVENVFFIAVKFGNDFVFAKIGKTNGTSINIILVLLKWPTMLIPEGGGGPSDASESPTTLPISIARSLPPSVTPLGENTADDTEDEG